MRIAVFTDVHGNLTALRAVLDDIERRGPFNLVVSAGDHICGGPRPLETWDELVGRGALMLRGNTERDIGHGRFPPEPAGGARRDMIVAVFDWALNQLPPAIRDAAAGLPTHLRLRMDSDRELLVTHANAENLDDFIWPDSSPEDLKRLIGEPAPAMLVGGHVHAPLDMQFNATRIVRPGSVGLKYEERWFNVAHWADIGWDASERRWTSATHEVTWDHRAEIEVGADVGYPGVEILPGYDAG